MAFLEPSSPIHRDKLLERALYLDLWAPHLPAPLADGARRRVLDLGGGIGRFTTWFLQQGWAVELVDPDLRSLWRAVSHAASAGGPGALDVHWSTGERLPPLASVDVAVLCEVLCYMEDPARALKKVARTLKPGGVLLASVEARWGWAMAADAHPRTIEGLFTGVVHVPGDVWVQTYTEEAFRALLAPHFELVTLQASHFAFSGPFELASGIASLSVPAALELEARLRAHPVAGKLNRAWMAVARLRE